MAIATNTPVMGSNGFLSPSVTAVLDKALLLRAVDNQVFDRYGFRKVIPSKSNTKQGAVRRYKNVLPATTPLAEYNGSNIKSPNKIVAEEVIFGVQHYGDYVTITDELETYDIHQVKSDFTNIMGDQASLTIDTINRDALLAGTNAVFADGAVDSASVADNAKVVTKSDLNLVALKLKNQRGKKFKKAIVGSTKIGTKPVRSGYVLIINPANTDDLRALAGWKDVEEYANPALAEEDEVGSIGDFRVIESTNTEPTEVNGVNVYSLIALAEEAYVTVSLRGKATIETIIKPVGTAGSDPLNQYGTIGWKAISGAKIVNQKWLVRIETVASQEDGDQKHYIDYSPMG